jgi:hypothetical protein
MPDSGGKDGKGSCSARQSKSARPQRADSRSAKRGGTSGRPIEELEPRFEIEFTEPGSALDAQLRREQTKAILDLLIAHKRKRSN